MSQWVMTQNYFKILNKKQPAKKKLKSRAKNLKEILFNERTHLK